MNVTKERRLCNFLNLDTIKPLSMKEGGEVYARVDPKKMKLYC